MGWSKSVERVACVVIGVAFVLGDPPLLADDTVVGSVGGKWQALNSEDIRMASETVKVRLGKKTAHVRCEFVLRNEGPAQRVKIGFPQKLGTAPLHSFRCWVDGEPVQVHSRVAKVGKDRIDTESAHMHPYEGWHWWWTSFAAGQTRRVVHTYVADYTEHSMGGMAFSYVLRTGANWKGTIGEALIEVDLGPAVMAHIYKVAPSGYRAKGNRLVWRWQDFEPEADLYVQWTHEPRVYFAARLGYGADSRHELRLPARDCMRGDVIFAPVRWLAKVSESQCHWDGAWETATLVPKSGRELRFEVGSPKAQCDWGPVHLDGRVYRLEGQVMVPLRAAAEWLGLSVRFSGGGHYAATIIPGP